MSDERIAELEAKIEELERELRCNRYIHDERSRRKREVQDGIENEFAGAAKLAIQMIPSFLEGLADIIDRSLKIQEERNKTIDKFINQVGDSFRIEIGSAAKTS